MDSVRGYGRPLERRLAWFTAAAKYLGLNQRTLYRLVDEGELRGYKLGRVHRFRRADLDAYLEASVIQPGDLRHLRPDT